MKKEFETLVESSQLLKDMVDLKEVYWTNPKLGKYDEIKGKLPVKEEEITEAEKRLERFAPFIAKHFEDTVERKGIIESPLKEIPNMLEEIKKEDDISGKLLLKMDSHLAVAGSIKARGGIYEVLKHTEELALENGLIKEGDDYSQLASEKNREFFNQYTIQVGSTGNLGLSIGITSAKIGYKVIVHMSQDARQWKKDLLRSKGVIVKEYESDYSLAVKEGRALSDADPMSYFIDDENSKDLFMGYAVAAKRLEKQLAESNVLVNEKNPLMVYIPCGVGGAPGGVAYGLKAIFKEAVHIYFVEPTHAPCMLLGMATGLHEKIAVTDIGIDGLTEADGLAVGRPSGFVGGVMDYIISGIFTMEDEKLFHYMRMLNSSEDVQIEPSACASFIGPAKLLEFEDSIKYLKDNNLLESKDNFTHIAWATGGNLVPKEIMESYLQK